MTEQLVLKLARDTLQVTLVVSAPLLLISLVIGVVISVVQVVTSIQDMTLSFVPRVVAVFLGFLLLLPWMLSLMIGFTTQLFAHLDRFAR